MFAYCPISECSIVQERVRQKMDLSKEVNQSRNKAMSLSVMLIDEAFAQLRR